MLAYVEIVTLYLKKINILYEGKERPAETKLMTAKLSTVLAYTQSLTLRSVSLRGVTYFENISATTN